MSNTVRSEGGEPKARRRVELDFSPEAYQRLKEIQALAGAKAYGEVVRNALRVYEWFLVQKRENRTIQVLSPDKMTAKEVELLL